MEPYLQAAGGNRKLGLHLYNWGDELASAIQATLRPTEIFLRNAMDAQLQTWNERENGKSSWLLEPPAAPLRSLTAGKRKTAVERAQRTLTTRPPNHPRHNVSLTHDDVLSQVMFGMWKDILPNHLPQSNPANLDNRNRVQLWEQCLVHAFPFEDDPTGEKTFWRVFHLHGLRNRVSHMDSLLNVDVADIVADAFDLIESINPVLRDWVTGTSTVMNVLRSRPF